MVAFQIICAGGPNADMEDEIQIWHPYICIPKVKLPKNWKHTVTGDGIDKNMIYKFFWHSLNSEPKNFHPKFIKVFEMIKNSI